MVTGICYDETLLGASWEPKRHQGPRTVPRLWSRGDAIDVDAQGLTRWIGGALVTFRAPLRARAKGALGGASSRLYRRSAQRPGVMHRRTR